MDIIKVIVERQDKYNITDAELSKRTGISEYTWYDLKRYKLYLTRVAYMAICAYLEMPVLSDNEIENALEENKRLVGSPESNLTVAAETIDPEYLEKIERELNSLKQENSNIEGKNRIIEDLQLKLEDINKKLKEKEDSLNEKIQQAYSDGVRDAMQKIPMMQQAENNKFVELLNEEYSEEIGRLQDALRTSRQQYKELYNYIAGYIERNVIGEKLYIDKFTLPYEESL